MRRSWPLVLLAAASPVAAAATPSTFWAFGFAGARHPHFTGFGANRTAGELALATDLPPRRALPGADSVLGARGSGPGGRWIDAIDPAAAAAYR